MRCLSRRDAPLLYLPRAAAPNRRSFGASDTVHAYRASGNELVFRAELKLLTPKAPNGFQFKFSSTGAINCRSEMGNTHLLAIHLCMHFSAVRRCRAAFNFINPIIFLSALRLLRARRGRPARAFGASCSDLFICRAFGRARNENKTRRRARRSFSIRSVYHHSPDAGRMNGHSSADVVRREVPRRIQKSRRSDSMRIPNALI